MTRFLAPRRRRGCDNPGTGEASLVGAIIPEGAKVAGVEIKDIAIPKECVVAAVIRGDTYVVPRGGTRIEEGDQVVFVGPAEAIKRALDLFVQKKPHTRKAPPAP